MDVLARLNTIFTEVFDDDTIVVGLESTANDIEGWDSLTHMNLIMAVESAFGVRFALGELQSLKNVGNLVSLIEKKCARP